MNTPLQDIIEVATRDAKFLAYHEIYLDLLMDERVPYTVCQKVKEKIDKLKKN